MRYAYFGRLSNEKHKGIVCFGYIISVCDNQIWYSTAFCSPKDNFNRKLAHKILQGRVRVGKFARLSYDTKNDVSKMMGKQVLGEVLSHYNELESSPHIHRPHWAYKIRCELYFPELPLNKKMLPFVAFGNEEMEGKPKIGETVVCEMCGKEHKVQYGEEVLSDGTKKPSKMLGFVKCGGKEYMVSLNGVDITKKHTIKGDDS